MGEYDIAMAIGIALGVALVVSIVLCSTGIIMARHRSAFENRLAAPDVGTTLGLDSPTRPQTPIRPRDASTTSTPNTSSPYRQAVSVGPSLPSEILFARSQLGVYPSDHPGHHFIPIPPSYNPNRRRLPSYEEASLEARAEEEERSSVIEIQLDHRGERRSSPSSSPSPSPNPSPSTQAAASSSMIELNPRRLSGDGSEDDYGEATDNDSVKGGSKRGEEEGERGRRSSDDVVLPLQLVRTDGRVRQ